MSEHSRIFNANAGSSWEGTFLHHAVEQRARRADNEVLFDFLVFYGAAPNIKIDQSGNEGWPARFPGFDGFDAIQLADALLRLPKDHRVMKLLRGERPPVDLFAKGVVKQPMIRQIGPVPLPPRRSKLIPGLLTALVTSLLTLQTIFA